MEVDSNDHQPLSFRARVAREREDIASGNRFMPRMAPARDRVRVQLGRRRREDDDNDEVEMEEPAPQRRLTNEQRRLMNEQRTFQETVSMVLDDDFNMLGHFWIGHRDEPEDIDLRAVDSQSRQLHLIVSPDNLPYQHGTEEWRRAHRLAERASMRLNFFSSLVHEWVMRPPDRKYGEVVGDWIARRRSRDS